MRTSLVLATAAGAVLTLAAAPGGAVSAPGEASTAADRLAPPLDPPVAPPTPGAPAETRAAAQSGGQPLTGTFRIDAGECDDGGATGGSYFRMINQAGGYVGNGSSPCGDGTYTPLRPGTDGGLVTGGYQPHPDPAFDGSGNALADRLTQPQAFFGTEFSTATNPTDPQTGTDVPQPEIVHDGDGGLSGDLRAFAAAWNGQHFNQGAPKPDGSRPGGTAGPSGTYDPATGRYTLEWTSRIQGGPFNGFTGQWHLEGTFEPATQPGTATGGDPGGAAGDEPDGAQSQPSGSPAGDPAAGEDGTAAPSGTDSASSPEGGSATEGELPQTGPGLPPAAGVLLLAGAVVVLRGRRRPAHRGGRP